MTVLHICNDFGNKLYGNLLRSLSRNQIIQKVYFPMRKGSNKNANIFDESDNIEVYRSNIQNIRTRINYKLKIKRMYADLKRNIDSFKDIDVIHAHTLFTDGGLAYKILKKENVKYIVSVRVTDWLIWRILFWRRSVAVEILKHAEAVIFISPNMKILFKKALSARGYIMDEKFIVIPNGIKDVYLQDKVTPKSFEGSVIRLIFIGRIILIKRLHTVLSFCIKYPSKFNLVVIGDGNSLYAKIMKRRMNKMKNVTFLGFLNDEHKIIQHLKESDIFILPSLMETFGIVYIEAMSQGVPVIFSENTGINNYFPEGKVGYPVKSTKYKEWLSVTEKIINNYHSISENCIKESVNLNWQNIAHTYIEVYSRSTQTKIV